MRDRTIHPAHYGLTTDQIEKIIDDVQKDIERQDRERGHTHCSCCGKPLGARFNVPVECEDCLNAGLDIPEFLKDHHEPDPDTAE